MSGRHTPATARIQSRLERWELDHLRMLAAEQAERIEQLEDQVASANQQADWWRESHHELEAHLNDGTSDARCIGLTRQGELLVVATGALQ